MALSTGQITDAFQTALKRAPTGSELAQYSSDNSLEGDPGKTTLISKLSPLQSSLNDFNSNLFNSANGVPTRVQSASEIAADLKGSGLLPNTPAPVAPNLVDTYTQLAQAKGVDAIQASITDLKAQQDEIAAQLRTNTAAERGKPVAQNVIEGRVGQETKNSQEQYDFVSRQLSRKTDEMNSALSSIQMIMQFTQQDYQNAAASYSQQFDQAISTINLIRGVQQDQKNDVQRAQDNARANLQIFTNAITAGNLNYKDLPPDQQANINKMEVQAGLPVGFTAALKEKLDPKANIISTSENQGQIQVLVKNPDGSISLQTYGTKNAGTGTDKPGSPGYVTTAKQNIVKGLEAAKNSYGDVSPATWQAALSAWIGDGVGNKQDFVNNFSSYADQNRGDFNTAYGFDKLTGKAFL